MSLILMDDILSFLIPYFNNLILNAKISNETKNVYLLYYEGRSRNKVHILIVN